MSSGIHIIKKESVLLVGLLAKWKMMHVKLITFLDIVMTENITGFHNEL